MRIPVYTKQFEKDIKKMKRRKKDLSKLKEVVRLIIEKEKLPQKYKEHKLIGNWNNRLECHIEPDWLLIYKIEEKRVIFERTGTHSDIF